MPTGWRAGPRDAARGAEFGAWLSALFTAPSAGAMVGGSLGMLLHAGFDWGSLMGLIVFAGRWAGIALTWGVLFAVPAGAVAWLYRGIARRLGRPEPDQPTRRRRRRRRWGVAGALGLVGLVAGAVAGNYLIRTSIRSAEEAVAETDAIDPDWRLDDLLAARDEVPDEENSALVAAAAVALLDESWPPEALEGEPGPDVREILGEAATLGEFDDSRRLDDASLAAIVASLEEQAEALELARTLADYDRGRHEYEIGPAVIDTLLPETQNVRGVARLLNADVIVAAHDGGPDDALASCRAMIAAGRSIGDEPFAIGQLVRIAIGSTASRAARRALGLGEPSDQALAALQDLALDERHQPRVRWGLRGERAILAEIIRRIAEGEMPISALSEGGAASATPGGGVSGMLVAGGWYQYAVALRWCNELIAILDLPEHEWPAAVARWDARNQSVKNSRLGMATSTLPLLLMPAVSAFITAEMRIRADLGSLVVLLAAERHRRATGRWPASAEEIGPEILPAPPLDPYTGEPFRVAHVDGRLRVYSLGPNLEDEGGAYDPRKAAEAHVEDDVGTYAYDPELRGRPAVEEEAP
ncbi:hypothetical protein [Paludisphaera sp.]|uniref:hypothetical protein n=1 Tax=Paludisphaera sp. TaxID=2017432 RepID=UPI00301D0805